MDAAAKFLPFVAREPTLLDKVYMTVRYPLDVFYHPFESIISLPALSFLVIPAFSSYGTTLNFLFFYMTWAILIRSNPPLQVELLGTLAIRVLFYILPSLGFLLFDGGAPGVAANIKEHGETALPMGEEQGGKKGRWWKITLVSIVNVLLSVALQSGVELLFTRVLHIRSALKITTSLPMPWSIVRDLALGLLMREVLTYALHRYVLHAPQSPLENMHTSWQHSVVSPFSMVAHYDHPLTYLVHVFLPMYIPAVFLRMHLLTYHVYLCIVSLEETFAYSGYNILPSGFILGGIARRQERHLMGGGEGNFGCFGLSDLLMGTGLGADLVDDVVDEADEKEVSMKAKGKAKSIKNQAEKKKTTSEQDEDDEEEEEEEEEEEQPKAKPRGGKRNERKDPNEDKGEDGQEEPKKPKRKARSNARNGKKSSGDAEEDDKPNRKPSNAGKRSVRQKKQNNEDDE